MRRKTREELEELIKEAQRLRYQEKFSVNEIATTLNISKTAASNYSRGNPSSRKSTAEYLRRKKAYERFLVKRLDRMKRTGYGIEKIKNRRTVRIIFAEKGIPVRDRMRDLIQSTEENLSRIGFVKLIPEFKFHYKDGNYYIRPQTIRAKAFLTSYAEQVLTEELIS
jgi:transcriptional regulator with XRE-family HTH domain